MPQNTDVTAELREALLAADEAERIYIEARGRATERRSEWTDKLKVVREIEQEIRTGSTGRRIIDQVGTVHTSEKASAAAAKETFAKSETPKRRKAVAS